MAKAYDVIRKGKTVGRVWMTMPPEDKERYQLSADKTKPEIQHFAEVEQKQVGPHSKRWSSRWTG